MEEPPRRRIIPEMAKALLVTSSFLPGRGGIETHLDRLCRSLAPALAVMAPASREGLPLPGGLGYPTSGFPARLLVPGPPTVNAIERVARSHGTSRVLFGTFWPLALVGPALARRGLRYAVMVHGAETLVPSATPPLRRAVVKALAGADLLLAVSDYTGRRVRELLERNGRPVPPIDLLSPAIDLDRFRPGIPAAETRKSWGVGPDARVVLSFGRLTPRKGIHRLIRVWPEVARRDPTARLVVAGAGPQLSALRRAGADNTSGGAVIFPGRVAAEDIPPMYCAADVFVLPVADRFLGFAVEGLGIVLLEAAACCLPSVTGRSGGTPEAVVEGTTGFVVDARDPKTLADAIARLLIDTTLATTMGKKGREHVSKHYSGELPASLLEWLA